MRNYKLLFLFVFFAVLQMQAKVISQQIDTSIPEQWQEDSALFIKQTPIEQKWWLQFNDPILTELIEMSIKSNYDLEKASYRIASAKGAMRVAEAGYYPNLDLSVVYDANKNIDDPGNINRVGSLGLDMQWEIDVIGSIRNKAKAKKLDYQAMKDQYNAVMTIIVAEVATAYVELRTAELRLEVVKKNLCSQSETLNITEARFKSGLSSALDVSQARSIYYSTEANVPQLENIVAQYINAIGVLTGEVPWEIEAKVKTETVKSSLYGAPIVPVSVPSEVIRQRPDVRAVEQEVNAEAALLGASIADWLPKFYLNGSIGYASQGFNDLFNSKALYWQIVPTVKWTIFAGTEFSGYTQIARANLEEQINNYNSVVLTALQEVDNAMNSYRYLTAESEARIRAYEESQTTMNLALDLYKKGLVDFQNVLDAQRTMLDLDNQRVVTKGETIVSLITLYRSLGGGWE